MSRRHILDERQIKVLAVRTWEGDSPGARADRVTVARGRSARVWRVRREALRSHPSLGREVFSWSPSWVKARKGG